MKQARGETLDRPMGMEIRRLAQWLEGPGKSRRRTLRLSDSWEEGEKER